MSIVDLFAGSYAEARLKLQAACIKTQATLHSTPLASPDPDGPGRTGSPLFTDIVTLGNPDASRLLLVVSGTHGPEALTGSACQLAFLHTAAAKGLGPDVRVVFVHILNAFGCASGLRCTEEGVDLNRNYVDFVKNRATLASQNPGYDLVQEQLQKFQARVSPADFVEGGPGMLREQCGADAVNRLFQGQYRFSDGAGFGGFEPTGARLRLEEVVTKHLSGATDVAMVDIHTGLGPFGIGLLLCLAAPTSLEAQRAQQWFGPGVSLVNAVDSDLPYRVNGDTCSGVAAMLKNAQVTGITLEFGTYPLEGLVQCILGEYLIRHATRTLDTTWQRDMLQRIRAFFYPQDADWRKGVIAQADAVMWQAVNGLKRAG